MPESNSPPIRNKEIRRVRVADLEDAPWNFRKHDDEQNAAFGGTVEEIGWYGYPDVYETSDGLRICDGHLRKAWLLQAYGPDAEIEVNVTDFDERDAKVATTTKDKLTEMASTDNERLSGMLRELQEQEVPLADIGWPEHLTEPLLAAEWSPPPIEDLPEGSDATKAKPIVVTPDQRETIARAIAKVRSIAADETISEGRCVELICGDYLAGP